MRVIPFEMSKRRGAERSNDVVGDDRHILRFPSCEVTRERSAPTLRIFDPGLSSKAPTLRVLSP